MWKFSWWTLYFVESQASRYWPRVSIFWKFSCQCVEIKPLLLMTCTPPFMNILYFASWYWHNFLWVYLPFISLCENLITPPYLLSCISLNSLLFTLHKLYVLVLGISYWSRRVSQRLKLSYNLLLLTFPESLYMVMALTIVLTSYMCA